MLAAFFQNQWRVSVRALLTVVLFSSGAVALTLFVSGELPEPFRSACFFGVPPTLMIAFVIAAWSGAEFGVPSTNPGDIERLLEQKRSSPPTPEAVTGAKKYPYAFKSVEIKSSPIPPELAEHVQPAAILSPKATFSEVSDVLNQLVTWKRRKR